MLKTTLGNYNVGIILILLVGQNQATGDLKMSRN